MEKSKDAPSTSTNGPEGDGADWSWSIIETAFASVAVVFCTQPLMVTP
jgi:hypothetical protein